MQKDHRIDTLNQLLADTYTLYLKTQNFHWNVEGHDFLALHAMFEAQYRDLAEAADEIAERIRVFKAYPSASFKAFLKITAIDEADEMPMAAKEMVRHLVSDHEKLAKSAQAALTAAVEKNDEGTADLCVSRLRFHQKTAWMLSSQLA